MPLSPFFRERVLGTTHCMMTPWSSPDITTDAHDGADHHRRNGAPVTRYCGRMSVPSHRSGCARRLRSASPIPGVMIRTVIGAHERPLSCHATRRTIAAPSVLAVLTGLIGLSGLVLSCSPSVNFSQYAGFHEYFATFPRYPAAATPQDQRLLEAYRPVSLSGQDRKVRSASMTTISLMGLSMTGRVMSLRATRALPSSTRIRMTRTPSLSTRLTARQRPRSCSHALTVQTCPDQASILS